MFGRIAPWMGLAVILALGLWLRIYLAGTPGYIGDLSWFRMWADAAHRGNIGSPYQLEGRAACNYPPGYILILSQIPWLYEAFTGQAFREPPDQKTGRFDEADRALQFQQVRRDMAKTRELVDHYKKHDPSRYQLIITGRLRPDELASLRLINKDEYREFYEWGRRGPEGYNAYAKKLAPRIREQLERELPYPAPDRLRQLAVWIKLPALLFDLAGAAMLFVLLRKRLGQRGGLLVAVIYLFLPAVLYDSASWGQVDAVHSLLMLLCLASLVAGHSFLVGLLFAMALLTKFQSIVIAPVLAAGLIRRWRDGLAEPSKPGQPAAGARVVQSVGLVLLGVVVAATVILAPFAAAGSAGKALNTYVQAPGSYSFVSVCAFNPWWLLNTKPDLPRWYYRFTTQDHEAFLGPIAPRHVGLLLLAAFSLWVMWLVYRRGCTYETIAAAGVAMALGFFVLPTEIHERYGFPAMILGAYLVGAGWRHLPVVLILSVAQFYNFTAAQPVEDPRYAWLMPVANAFEGVGSVTVVWVLIHVGSLVYFTRVLYRLPVSHQTVQGRRESGTGAGRSLRRSHRRKGP